VPSKRQHVLMAALLVLWSEPYRAQPSGNPALRPPESVANTNSVSGVWVRPDAADGWLLDFDYVYTGDPPAMLRIEVTPQAGTDTAPFSTPLTPQYPPKPGAHHVATALQYPGEGTSGQVVVAIATTAPNYKVLASQSVDQVIRWPTQEEKDFDTAYAMIDSGHREALREARSVLERLISKNPKFEAGYVELARIAMRTSRGGEGLHQAEILLDSALTLQPDSANAKILLGYVYTHQGRLDEAQALFTEAAGSNPPNVWLWVNWGELLETRGDAEQAIGKYRDALAKPSASLKNFRPRESAYLRLLQLLRDRDDADGMETLFEERIREFGSTSCYSTDYARFKLTVRGDAQGAIDLARGTLNRNCDDAPARQVLGLASYVKWAEGGAESVEALHQARIFIPAGPMTLYLLAGSDSTISAAKRLIADGEAVDQKDNEEMTALAYALQAQELDAAERLLDLGARPDTPVSVEAIPVALLPVLNGDAEAIRRLKRAGVDYSKLRFRGATALDFAKQIGDDELLKALQPDGRTL
jgi:tetratricopeptide (TPR) repeat protein